MGGFLSWRVGNSLPVMLGLWPVIALSGTLAGEAAKGSLDLLASTPQGRRTIALQKLAGHVTAVDLRDAHPGRRIWVVGAAFGSLPGDEIPFAAALGQVLLYGLMMLAVGGVAFATAPCVGRTRAMAFGLIALFASYLIYSYATPVAGHRCAASRCRSSPGRPGHRPMAGVTDWPSIALLAAVDCRALRDRRRRRSPGATSAASRTSAGCACRRCRPGSAVRSRRQLADRAGVAIALGSRRSGCTGSLIVASADAFSDDDRIAAADRGDHRGDLPGPRPDPAVGRPPADVLRLRLVHHRAGRRVVPGRLGQRRGPAPPRGRPVDAAVAGQLGDPQRARACWPRSAS